MERFFSTRASGLDVICLGSVMAWDAGRVWDAVRTLMSTTITNRLRVRMVPRMEFVNRESLAAPLRLQPPSLLDRYPVVPALPSGGAFQ